MSLQFLTKAGTLSQLRENLFSAQIAPIVVFTVADWLTDREMTYQARRRFSRDQHATVSGDLKTVLSAY